MEPLNVSISDIHNELQKRHIMKEKAQGIKMSEELESNAQNECTPYIPGEQINGSSDY